MNRINHFFLMTGITVCFSIVNSTMYAQNIGINALGVAPNSASILDLNTGNTFTSPNGKGFLPPNVALTGRTDAVTISSPPNSLLVYNTATANTGTLSVTPGYYYWQSSTNTWVSLGGAVSGSNNWNILGNAGTTAGTNFLGTTDNQDLVFKRSNIFSGLISFNNTAFGYSALSANTTGFNNTAFGGNTLKNNTIGGSNTAIGFEALLNNTTGNLLTGIGKWALTNNTTGSNNTSVGNNSLRSNTIGSNNTTMGESSLAANINGNNNSGFGWYALLNNTSGSNNTAIGDFALSANTQGINNTANGSQSLYFNTVGSNNTAIGSYAAYGTSSASYTNNCVFGYGAGYNLNTGANNNILLGYQAGNAITTGSSNIVIGYDIDAPSNTSSNQLSLGNLIFGNGIDGTGTAVSTGNIGIATASPNTKLDVNGSFAMREGAALALANGANTNIALSNFSFFRITGPTGAFSITGLTGGVDGRLVTIYNTTSQIMTITNEATSTAANQIRTLTGANIVCPAGPNAIQLQYNATVARWILIGGQNINSSNDWSVLGNAGTVDGVNFLGTTDAVPLNFRVANQKAGRVELFGSVFLGSLAGNSNNAANPITGIGRESLLNNTSGSNNSALGRATLYTNTTGNNNTAVGSNALYTNNGSNNEAFGTSALYSNTSGGNNVSIGGASMLSNTTGGNNVAVGNTALAGNTSGNHNVAIGDNSLRQNQIGEENTITGSSSTYYNISGSYNTANGYQALFRNLANYNTAIGHNSLLDCTTGSQNVAIGAGSGITNTTGSKNTFVGVFADGSSMAFTNATAIGYNAKVGASNALILGGTGSDAVRVGVGITAPSRLMEVFSPGDAELGVSSTNNGNFCGGTVVLRAVNSDGSRALGTFMHDDFNDVEWFAGRSYNAPNDNFVINRVASKPSHDRSVTAAGNELFYIEGATGEVGIGTNSPTSLLSVNGTASKVGGGAWAVFSDARVKQNINKYSKGLDYILKIQPVTFEYNGKGGYKVDGKTYVGVIAQEMEKVLPSTVSKVKTTDFEDQRIFDASELTFTLINSIKELNQKNEVLVNTIEELKNQIKESKTINNKYEERLKLLEANMHK